MTPILTQRRAASGGYLLTIMAFALKSRIVVRSTNWSSMTGFTQSKMDDNTWWLRVGDARVMVTFENDRQPTVDVLRAFHAPLKGTTLTHDSQARANDPKTSSPQRGLPTCVRRIRRPGASSASADALNLAEATRDGASRKSGRQTPRSGVSVSPEQPTVPASSATRGAIEGGRFDLVHSPTVSDPFHRTLILPKPVTRTVADQFNSIFGRSYR